MAVRTLSDAQQKEFFEILGDPKDLNADTICALFAYSKKNNGIRFYTSDIITIGPEQSEFVKPGTKTTTGIYIVNKFVFEDLRIFGYVNKEINGKTNDKINEMLANALLAEDINRDQYVDYIDRTQWLYGGPFALIVNTSLSENVLTLPPAAKAKRKQLLEENKEALAANDAQVAVHVEHEIVDVAAEEMRKKNDPAMALFDSNSGVNLYNQYKTICVMKGAIQDNTGESPTGYKIITSNYDTGITKEDMPKIADSVVTTAYSSGVSTQDSGTNCKKYNALFQRIRIQDRGSDCGSTEGLDVLITEKNWEDYIYRYIMDGKKLIMLTPETVKKYFGKTVKMRSGIYCKAKDPEYCSKCIGDRPYRIGIRNIGFTYMTISGSTLNAALKKKHDVSIHLYNVTIDDLMKYVK